MRQIAAVLFDYGGTLTRLAVSEAELKTRCLRRVRRFLRTRGISVTEKQLRDADVKAWELSRPSETHREVDAYELILNLLEEVGVKASVGDQLVRDVARVDFMTAVPYIELLPDTIPTLKALRRCNIKMGVVSNNLFPQMLKESIERLNLKPYLDTVVASGDVGVRKPAPEVFKRALLNLKCQAKETLFVGDTLEEDIVGAKELDMSTVWLNRSSSRGIESIVPDYEVRCLSDILPLLGIA
ncbi:MAG: HAD family hydrolase [Candidatus Bathyarchaeia archaeon]